MSRQTLILVSLSLMAAIALSNCQPPGPAGSADLVPSGRSDISAPLSFCKLVTEGPDKGKLMVTVKNQGTTAAPASATLLEFSPGGPLQVSTPAIPAGASVDLGPLSAPGGCYNPDCEFKITVDSNNQINESNEGNNSANGQCIG